jgi:hypothetical protein
MSKFITGHEVYWTSQAQGRAKCKAGIVVEVVAPGVRPSLAGCGFARNHESYVVEVPQGPNAKPQRYWPVVSNLHQVPLSEVGATSKRADLDLAGMKAVLEAALPDTTVWCEDGETWFVTRKPLGEGDTEEDAVSDAYSKLPFLGAGPCTSHAYERDLRQAAFVHFAIEAFGEEQARSIPQRGVRLLEESDETAQAAGVTREMAHKLVDFVWDRPVGELSQELGGVGVTLLALASAAGLSAEAMEVQEVQRVLAKPLAHFSQRNEAKNAAGFLIVESDSTGRDTDI